ncbi:MAG: D-tagatose-bisphosphate aldolase, class II, non-catalytic subunit [Acuticoccus sp.]
MVDIKGLIARNRAGERVGLPSFCTANAHVLRAILANTARTGWPTVIEATCNQVNQDGGYTGMTAADFMAFLTRLAAEEGAPLDRIVVGGDHLGPNPWRTAPADEAMAKAGELVRQYAAAGFTKIHLDASMALGGEAPPSFATIAARAATLAAIAEASAPDPDALVYVIGTEVPIPGGETEEVDALDVTSVDRFADTIATHREAFCARRLDAAFGRVVSIVTQPGVDFSHTSVYAFDPQPAAPLRRAIAAQDGLTFEAHSTDYQPDAALRGLVDHHFVFLKVGPELTFRLREAIFALADIEDVIAPAAPSHLRETVAAAMAERPADWAAYYKGAPAEVERLKLYSYSDRIRYYWSVPQVASALDRLMANLGAHAPSANIVSRFFNSHEFGAIPSAPATLLAEHVRRCIRRYYAACGFR